MTIQEQEIVNLFFDFYVLEYLDFYAGESGLRINHANRSTRISCKTQQIVDKFYDLILPALKESYS